MITIKLSYNSLFRDCRLSPRCKWDLRPFRVFRTVDC